MEQKHIQLHRYVGIKLLLVVFSIFSCKNNAKPIISDFKGEESPVFGLWHKLTKSDQGSYIIYTPCDALNTTVLLKEGLKI